MRAFIVGSLVLAGSVSGSLAGVQAADPPPVTVAIVRADGILIPFATRTGRRWSNAWPTPSKRAEVPVQMSDVPRQWWGKAGPAAEWHAWFIAGGTARATADRLAWYPAQCDRGIGLQSTIAGSGRQPPATTSPYPKLGLAATGPLRFQRIETLDATHPIWPVLTAALAKPVADAETRIYLQQQSSEEFRAAFDEPDAGRSRHYSKPPRVLPGATRVDRLHRVPLGEARFLHHFEAVRRYPEGIDERSRAPGFAPRQRACEGMTFASGWFISNGAAVPKKLSADIRLVSCQYDRAQGMLPLGYLTDERETTWIAQLTSWERERYVVVRASPQRREPDIALITHGGGCGSS